jgi:osmotically-inducible protein OsmY
MNRGTAHLMDQVRLAVHAEPHLARRNLQFEHCGSRVTVRGTVESYYQKQLAQETLRRIDGIDEIENYVSVCWPTEVGAGLAQSV